MKDSTLTCLWADDPKEEDFRFFHPRIREFGWELRCGKTRKDSLEALEHGFFDVFILDSYLPNDRESDREGMVNLYAGIQLLQEISKPEWKGISRLGDSRNIRVVVMWTYMCSAESTELVWNCIEKSRDFFLHKPLSSTEFEEVFQVINRRLKSIKGTGPEQET